MGFAAGCSGFWDKPSSSSGGGGGSTLSSSDFYILNQQTTQVAAYTIASGSLAKISGSPYTLLSAPLSIAIDPKGSFLYVGTATGIFLYSIGSNGQLTLANSGNVISTDIATTMQVDPSGQWLLEAGPNLKELLAIRINPANGVPLSTTEQVALLPAATVQQIAVSPDNASVFVALGSSGTQDIAFGSGSTGSPFGSSLNIPTISVAGAALSVSVDPLGRLLYIGETAALSGTPPPSNTGGMRVFEYNSLTELTGSPFATDGLSPVVILPLPYGVNKGNYVYVANRNVSGSTAGLIKGYFVTTSGTTHSVSAMSNSTPVGNLPLGMAQEGMGNYLLVVNSGGNPDLQGFTFDSTTAGKLDSAFSSVTGTDPVRASAIAAAP
jgi:6-phosphogluconolactonase (cycloisomerase 2 family)